jgi:hypothetical protein
MLSTVGREARVSYNPFEPISIVTVLAGGWSAKAVDKTQLPGFVIAINDSAVHAPFNAVCSMDRLWVEGRWSDLARIHSPTYLRIQALKNISRPLPGHIYPFACDTEDPYFTTAFDDGLNGNNSGMCGFNLAYLYLKVSRSPRKIIFLMGFDMRHGPKGERHWYSDYKWGGGKVSGDWAPRFSAAYACCKSAGIEVFNVGDWSLLSCFPRVKPEDLACDRLP